MILCIPYNPTLPGGYDKLTNAILRNGRHPNHTLFVTSKEEHGDGAFEFAMKIQAQFGRYFAVTIQDQKEGALHASNRMFVSALDALRQYEPSDSEMPEPVMLYFDPTWRPTKQRWLDEFQAEYYIAGAPTTFGHFKRTGGVGRVVGPVAIKRDFLQKTKLLSFLPPDVHWREFLSWEIIGCGLQAEALGRILPAYIRPFDP